VCTCRRTGGDAEPDDPGGQLWFCHGPAGVLAIADAFALHTGLEPAARLADHLCRFLLERSSDLTDRAATDLTMLSRSFVGRPAFTGRQ
jgi:hypothetical protein